MSYIDRLPPQMLFMETRQAVWSYDDEAVARKQGISLDMLSSHGKHRYRTVASTLPEAVHVLRTSFSVQVDGYAAYASVVKDMTYGIWYRRLKRRGKKKPSASYRIRKELLQGNLRSDAWLMQEDGLYQVFEAIYKKRKQRRIQTCTTVLVDCSALPHRVPLRLREIFRKRNSSRQEEGIIPVLRTLQKL